MQGMKPYYELRGYNKYFFCGACRYCLSVGLFMPKECPNCNIPIDLSDWGIKPTPPKNKKKVYCVKTCRGSFDYVQNVFGMLQQQAIIYFRNTYDQPIEWADCKQMETIDKEVYKEEVYYTVAFLFETEVNL